MIASVGHHTDRTLLDDVAAVSCSTPTHAAEAAVAVDCVARATRAARAAAARLRDHGRRVLARARAGARPRACATMAAAPCSSAPACSRRFSRAPAEHVERERERLHQQLREIRAGSRRRLDARAGG